MVATDLDVDVVVGAVEDVVLGSGAVAVGAGGVMTE